MRIKSLYMATACIAALAQPAGADVINFESGFRDQQAVGAVTTATNTVTLSVGSAETPLASSDTRNAFIARAGGKTTAFVSHDNTANPSVSGQFFLTDDFDGPRARLNYFLLFDVPVVDLSLDLYDYRIDGGPTPGSRATLTVYSDPFLTPIAEDFFAIPNDRRQNPEDGNIESLEVLDAAFPIFAAALTFDATDNGTGIDNISFNTSVMNSPLRASSFINNPRSAVAQAVPEPATALLMGLGLVGVVVGRRRRGFDPAPCV